MAGCEPAYPGYLVRQAEQFGGTPVVAGERGRLRADIFLAGDSGRPPLDLSIRYGAGHRRSEEPWARARLSPGHRQCRIIGVLIVDASLIEKLARLRGIGDAYHDYQGQLKYF